MKNIEIGSPLKDSQHKSIEVKNVELWNERTDHSETNKKVML